MNIKRGGVYLAALDPTVGREIAKTRPVVVVSNDQNNLYACMVSIVPLTSKNTEKIYPFEIFLPRETANLPKNSKGKADQIRTIDKSRLVQFIGELTDEEMAKIEKAVRIHLALA
ncbi:MAG TPA: type II toxin-antitoxin system PemK/MazF family toxin [Smithellaceae bacterium]|nr:type II toxin-antitoxin system PemK/MazF family toxin [Smithellaceae bacterium]HRV44436.1 type II toxin-antitoxin system PemK/MazF family toxin [Smithellaceae bacterium]